MSFSSAFADDQVIIPLGASNPENPFSLSPSVLVANINDTITWQNQDNAIHTVTTGNPQLGFDGRIDSGPIKPGQSFSYQFTKAGVFPYFCVVHPWMTGLVTIENGTPQPVDKISLSTDKSSYKTGDLIQISGHVSKFIPNEIISVWITDSQGRLVASRHIETNDGITYSTSIPVGGGLWVSGNTYQVFAQYGSESTIEYSTITFEPQSLPNQNILQENNTMQATLSNPSSYPSSHAKILADSNNYVTAQADYHIYIPGSEVKISGSIWPGMFQQVGGPAYLVTVPVVYDTSNSVTEIVNIQLHGPGNIVLNQTSQIDKNGDYSATFNLPSSVTGMYTAESVIQTKTGLLNALDESVSAKLQSQANFFVTSPQQFDVKTSTGDYNVKLGSNSTVSNFQFRPDYKEISFVATGETGTHGVTIVTIPKAILSGQLKVLIDGILQPYNSDNVIISDDNNVDTSLEINYHHSSHVIEIVGTQAAQIQSIPEFGSISALVLVMAVSIVVISAKTGRLIPGLSNS